MREFSELMLKLVGLGFQAPAIFFLLANDINKALICEGVSVILIFIEEYMGYLDEERGLKKRLTR